MTKILINLNLLARFTHRICVYAISLLGIFMVVTGLLMKYSPGLMIKGNFVGWDVLGLKIPADLVRYSHNQVSLYFSLLLTVMIATGLYLKFYPDLRKKFDNHENQQTPR